MNPDETPRPVERRPARISSREEMELVQAAFSGDGSAFGRLVERYQNPVYNLCWRYMRGDEARDLAQDTFVRAFVHRHKFSGDRSVLPWLLTIARNLCIDRLRKSAREPLALDDKKELRGEGPDGENALDAKQMLTKVQQELVRLPEGQREALMLHSVEGLAYKDIARVLDVPQGTVMTWIHRGRSALKDAVGDDR